MFLVCTVTKELPRRTTSSACHLLYESTVGWAAMDEGRTPGSHGRCLPTSLHSTLLLFKNIICCSHHVLRSIIWQHISIQIIYLTL